MLRTTREVVASLQMKFNQHPYEPYIMLKYVTLLVIC